MKKFLSVIAAAMIASQPLAAHDLVSGDLHIIHPSIPDPFPSAKSAAGYVAISNDGETPERLIGVRSSFSRAASVHETVTNDEGIARMQPVTDLVIAPGDTLVMEPGGMHVMFMGLQKTADEGDMIPVTLIFEKAGEIEVEFMVDALGSVDHSKMDHSKHSD